MTLTITLPAELARLVADKVASGEYARADDVIGAALLALDDQQMIDAKTLKGLWDDGIASGDAGEIDTSDVKLRGRDRLANG